MEDEIELLVLDTALYRFVERMINRGDVEELLALGIGADLALAAAASHGRAAAQLAGTLSTITSTLSAIIHQMPPFAIGCAPRNCRQMAHDYSSAGSC